MEYFSANLRAHRVEKGLTQEELSAQVGLSTRYVAKLESGAANVRLSTLADLSAALRVQFDEFLVPRSLPKKRATGRPKK